VRTQDHAAGWWMYGQSLHISIMVNIDQATKENGALPSSARM
jgi:ectoine hydroxylase-related dioxygenase (phytanoyl-CoA dioxygenase family)